MADQPERDLGHVAEWELVRLVAELVPVAFPHGEHVVDEARSTRGRGDLEIQMPDGGVIVVEVKSNTPQTLGRAEQLVRQLDEIRQSYRTDQMLLQLILAVPGVITPKFADVVRNRGIDLWDGRELLRLGRAASAQLSSEALSVLQSLAALTEEPKLLQPEFLARLDRVQCGRTDAYRFQDLCVELLEYLFCPPLERPIVESANIPRVNRRDIILPNYATDGFWSFMRTSYQADFVVVDAKNLCRGVTKNDVLQLANYLAGHGTGLFGMLITRTGSEFSAEATRREQWVINQKLMIVLNDDDLRQMILTKDSGGSPEASIRQKIETFRLGF